MKKEIDTEAMRLIADLLKTFMPPNWGFTLLTFETNNEAAKVNYISTAERERMKGTLRAMLEKWDATDEFRKNLNDN